jgi:hypothetical protein
MPTSERSLTEEKQDSQIIFFTSVKKITVNSFKQLQFLLAYFTGKARACQQVKEA